MVWYYFEQFSIPYIIFNRTLKIKYFLHKKFRYKIVIKLYLNKQIIKKKVKF